MHSPDAVQTPTTQLGVRVGCRLGYLASEPTPILLLLAPGLDASRTVVDEQFIASSGLPVQRALDTHGNRIFRTQLAPGHNEFRHDAIFLVPDLFDNHALPTDVVPPEQLPLDVLRYTFPSRYCESDKLQGFATREFGHLPPGAERVRAICDWVHDHVEYRYGSGDASLSAADLLRRGYGVCRDFAHLTVALCRALDLPARYVAGHVPYMAANAVAGDNDIGIDFHAYAEVYLGGHWHTFDARYNRPFKGRIKIAHGMDAADAAFATIYGHITSTMFQVWSYQVDPDAVQVGDLIGYSGQAVPAREAAL